MTQIIKIITITKTIIAIDKKLGLIYDLEFLLVFLLLLLSG